MTKGIVPLLFAAAFLAAPAAGRQPQAAPENAPAAPAPSENASDDGHHVLVVTDEQRDGATPEARDGRARVFTVRTDGGNTIEIRAKDGQTYRIDRDDHGVFVVNARDGTSYRVRQGDGGVIVLRAKDGRVDRLNGGPDRVIRVRVKDGETPRVVRLQTVVSSSSAADSRHVLMLDTGNGVQRLALENCGGDTPLVDRTDGDDHDRTRIILCGNHARGDADRSAELEHMLERLQDMDGVSDSVKLRVSAALRDAIEQLRRMR